MSKNEACRQWHEMALEAKKIEQDVSIPAWQKAYKIPEAYTGLELSGLRSKHRHRILNALQAINKIMAPYEFTSFDDYHLMTDKEIQRIIVLAGELSPR